ncbi:TetR family transcriptional regulator C-terminal domain-containing protein [Aquimarina sp. ERC-38]|uniref:TetR family transcriptional regulator C-terminal domain-containing protein n=1 Tax=Aquimarina sp. ERC-38 TaxID=2949996 RepID=UPI0022458890|nr:TetR family transcriptional regulator C-terminal domain-containing protein [Aquimarina sp. ERC-38]UZO79422.1 TetR family transcriptional regulator C-terminal domain-containing protein [Aquimarina sp. ERC-38]
MAGTKAKKTEKVDKKWIVSRFMHFTLEHDGYPSSVYKFCKAEKIEEEAFYKYFGSIERAKQGVWEVFFTNAMDVMNANKEYQDFSSREKMLTFFYTYFELLTLNRSYILLASSQGEQPLKNLEQLKTLRRHVKSFAADLIEDDNQDKQFALIKNPVAIFSEGAWLQFLFLLNFWRKDNSAGFEQTDVAIEKSVNTIFDVFDNTPLNNVLDFGKFLWQQRSM